MIKIVFIICISVSSDTLKVYEDRWFSLDKFHHFFYSLAISALTFHYLYCQNGWEYEKARNLSLGLTSGLGLSKEIYDLKIKKTKFSYKDLLFDLLGLSFSYFMLIKK